MAIWKLPGGNCRTECIRNYLAWKNGLTAEEYFKKIQGTIVKIKAGVCSGKCGGCAGNAYEFEESPEGTGEGESGVRAINSFEQEVIRRQTAQDICNEQNTAGNVPNGLAAWAKRQLMPPTIDWRQKLAGLVRRTVSAAAGAVDYTYRKSSRRGTGLRHYLGSNCPIMPSLYRPVPSVALILDVSGSMCGGPAESARSEIMAIVRAVGCSVDVFICDTHVADKKKVNCVADVIKLGETLGGTDMAHAIEEVAVMAKHDVLIVLTDGDTEWHKPGIVKQNVLAAITPGGKVPPDYVKMVMMK